MANKKNMSARFASAATRRESRRRVEARARTDLGGIHSDLPDGREEILPRQSTAIMAAQRSSARPSGAPEAALPFSSRAPLAPRSARPPLARPGGTRPASARGLAPLRSASGPATVINYSYLRGDLRRIVLLSVSLLVLLIVLNLLLNH